MKNQNKQYKSIQDLISNDQQAKEYFMTLSEDLQGGIHMHSEQVHSLKELQEYVMDSVAKRSK